MLYFKIETKCKVKGDSPFELFDGEIVNTPVDAEPDTADEAPTPAMATEYSASHSPHTYAFISKRNADEYAIGIITKKPSPIGICEELMGLFDIKRDCVDVSEITLSEMRRMLSGAESCDLIDSRDAVLSRFSLDKLEGYSVPDFTEQMTEVHSCAELRADAAHHIMSDGLCEEIGRIERAVHAPHVYGHPVHYLISGADLAPDTAAESMLLSALCSVGRLHSRRVTVFNVELATSVSASALDRIYSTAVGGAIVLHLGLEANSSADEETVKSLFSVINSYRNEVLTVISLPRDSKHIKAELAKHFSPLSMLEIGANVYIDESARAELREMCVSRGTAPDSMLENAVQPSILYTREKLTGLFNSWLDEKQKNEIYPEYRECSLAFNEKELKADVGSAYGELMSMIGLTEAKAVINKALNYFKMRKLYKERGIKDSNPTMHMVFTGNPGTAKTTVARLFARILKENGLLSGGQFIECGRADIIGKYTGWTAKNVRAKFAAADGGVLFIDEAYSLLDHQENSFGDEAINAIVQEMENNRENVVVILAGYPDNMQELLERNPGLSSRVAFHVPFSDYDENELCDIARHIASSNGMRFEDAALKKLRRLFSEARHSTGFGNGRYARNIFEQSRMNQASRLLLRDYNSITTESITTITATDIDDPTPISRPKALPRAVGFV